MRRSLVLCLLVLFPAAAPVQSRGQEAGSLPKGETVLADYLEATGGKAAYEKFKNRTLSGEVEIPGANIKGKVKITQAAPNRILVVMELGQAGKNVQATDGKDAWETSLTGERLLDGAEKDDFIRKATFNEEVHRIKLYDKIECVGIEDVAGKPAYKVVLTAKTGKVETEFYDKASHLLVKEVSTSKSPMGEFTVESFPSDYKRVDGILFPFTATEKALGQEITVKLTEIKHDVDLPDDTFKRPASLDGAAKKKAD
jgi:zinc protease